MPSQRMHPLPKPLWWLAFAGVAALAAILRFRELGELSVWLDEAITWERSTKPISELFDDSVRRNHTPTYFLLMHYVLQWGDDEFMLRLPSAVFGTVKVLMTCVLGTIAGGHRVGLLSGLIVALVPQQLHYDQEARMYALFGLCTTTGLCGLVWLLRHPEARARPLFRSGNHNAVSRVELRSTRLAWAALAAGTAGALSSHNMAVFFPVATGAAALVSLAAVGTHRAAFARNWLTTHVVIFALWLPWLWTLVDQAQRVHEHFWAQFPDSEKIIKILSDLYLFGAQEVWLAPMCAAMLAAGLWALRRTPALAGSLVLLTALTPALVLIVSFERPVFLPRVMLWTVVPWAVLLAFCGNALRPRPAFITVVAVVAGLGLVNLERHYYGARRKPNWKAALGAITSQRSPDALVLMSGGRESRQVRYYLQRKTRRMPWFRNFNVSSDSKLKQVPGQLKNRREVWLIHRSPKRYTPRVIRLLRKRGRQTFRRHYGHSLHVRRFRMRAPKS